MTDFFISYTGVDRAWAEWIAWQLEEAGYTTILQAWDFRPGTSFAYAMQQATAIAARTIAVVSPDYLTSRFTQPEWEAAFVQDPTGEQGLLLPIRVCEYDLKGLLPRIVYIDLVGLEEAAAKEALLTGVRRERAKPVTSPGFPGARQCPEGGRPHFPASACAATPAAEHRGRSDNITGAQYNRVLLDVDCIHYRKLKIDNKESTMYKFIPDGSLLSYVLEELIACSAVGMVVAKDTAVAGFLETLPPILRSRVTVVDDAKVMKQVYAILMLIADTFEFKYTSNSIGFESPKHPKELQLAVCYIHNSLISLLRGIEFELEIDIDIAQTRQSAQIIRHRSRNPEVRGFMAALEGILNTYKGVNIPGLQMTPWASPKLITAFTRLVEDQSYAQMSTHAHSLGIPHHAQRALVVMRRKAADIANSQKFSSLLNLGSKWIKTSSEIPVPDSEFAASFLKKSYLPPIVSIYEAVRRAKENWEENSNSR